MSNKGSAVLEPGVDHSKTDALRALNDQHVLNTYGQRKLAFVRGEGARLWDADGNEYLDFFAGIAVVGLGHCHPAVTKAITEQARKLVHTSNLYYIEPQVRLAEKLSAASFADRWFFCNSGAEANEAAFKLARRYWAKRGTPKPTIISAKHSFHGRTYATLTATAQPKYQEGFEPLLPGFKHVTYDKLDELDQAFTADVGAVILEVIQGEGGVRVASDGYIAGVRELCDKKGALFILDEVQTGMGRTGKLFAHEHAGVTPDIMTLAKGLGNGIPIGAMGCTEEAASGFDPGMHASTFGGNFLVTAAAGAVVDQMTAPGFLDSVARTGDYFRAELKALATKHEQIVDVRGKGLMIGVELSKPVGPVIDAMLDRRIVCGPAGPNVVRFVPPLIVTPSDADKVVAAFDDALQSV